MKGSEVHQMGDTELVEALKEARRESFNLRLRIASGELENSSRLGHSRRDLARLRTGARPRGIHLETPLT